MGFYMSSKHEGKNHPNNVCLSNITRPVIAENIEVNKILSIILQYKKLQSGFLVTSSYNLLLVSLISNC